MADELAVAHSYCLDRYARRFLLSKVLAYNITIYKNQHYNVGYILTFIINYIYMSVTKFTCNFVTDSGWFLRYILSLRRCS